MRIQKHKGIHRLNKCLVSILKRECILVANKTFGSVKYAVFLLGGLEEQRRVHNTHGYGLIILNGNTTNEKQTIPMGKLLFFY